MTRKARLSIAFCVVCSALPVAVWTKADGFALTVLLSGVLILAIGETRLIKRLLNKLLDSRHACRIDRRSDQ